MRNLMQVETLGYILLSLLGIIMLTSIAPDRVAQQALLSVFGLLALLYISRQDTELFLNFATPLYLLAITMLILTYFLGDVVRGSVRWIDIFGFRLQTSEFAKPLLIIAFAAFLRRFPPTTLRNILRNTGLFLLPALLIFRQPDLGSALVLAAIWGTMIFVAGLPTLWLLGSAVLGGVGIYLSPQFLHSYQLDRLRTFLDPYQDPLGSGYNVIQAIIAVGSGQLLGKGLGRGTQSHFRFLPERHTDFMFASLAEELGLVGGVGVIILVVAILLSLLHRAMRATSRADSYLLAGVFGYFIFQSAINIGMNLGVAPVTGVTLPLISYGGSSALSTGIIFGLAAAAGRRRTTSVLEIK